MSFSWKIQCDWQAQELQWGLKPYKGCLQSSRRRWWWRRWRWRSRAPLSADIVTRLRFLCYDINCKGKKKIEVSALTVHSSLSARAAAAASAPPQPLQKPPENKKGLQHLQKKRWSPSSKRKILQALHYILITQTHQPATNFFNKILRLLHASLILRVPPWYYSSVFLRFRAIPVTICRQYNDHCRTGRLDKSRVSKTISGGLSSIASPHQFDCRPRPRPRWWAWRSWF